MLATRHDRVKTNLGVTRGDAVMIVMAVRGSSGQFHKSLLQSLHSTAVVGADQQALALGNGVVGDTAVDEHVRAEL